MSLPVDALRMSAPVGAVTFTVHGKSATKGSSVSFLGEAGAVVTKADNRRLGEWTQAVAWSAKVAGVRRIPKPRAAGVRLVLVFPRPPRVSVAARPYMTVPPDVDKCLRAALDALTGIAYDDDAQIVVSSQIKVYGDRAETIIQVWEVRP